MKKNFLLIIFLWSSFFGVSRDLDSTALILIDIQNFYFPGGRAELVEPEKAAKNAQKILANFRENNALVVHIRHNFEPGGEIHELVEPLSAENVISKDEVNCFLDTNLNELLIKNNIKKLVLAGMQTHMCLEAGTRAAHDLGFSCTVIGDACATRDLRFEDMNIDASDVHFSTLATLKSYAQIVSCNEYLNPVK